MEALLALPWVWTGQQRTAYWGLVCRGWGGGGETGVAGLPEPRNAGSFTLVQIQGGTLLLLYLDTVASHGELQE